MLPCTFERCSAGTVFERRPRARRLAARSQLLTPASRSAATAVDRVVQFFKTPEQLDFSNLSAQATTQVRGCWLLEWVAVHTAASVAAAPRSPPSQPQHSPARKLAAHPSIPAAGARTAAGSTICGGRAAEPAQAEAAPGAGCTQGRWRGWCSGRGRQAWQLGRGRSKQAAPHNMLTAVVCRCPMLKRCPLLGLVSCCDRVFMLV